jgi:hypothetical protein
VTVAACPGFSVTGKVAPDQVKPAPVSVAALIVTGAVPVELRETDRVAGVFTVTSPKERLVELRVRVGTAAFNCKAKVVAAPPALAVSVAVCVVPTEDTVAVKLALVALAGTVTVAGIVTAVLLLERFTLSPPLPAAAFSVTVQESVPAPVIDALPQESPLNVPATASPVPLRAMTTVALVEELLVTVN